MKTKNLILSFLFCMILTIFCDALLWDAGTVNNSNFVGKFFYLLLSWVSVDIIYHILLYLAYFILVQYIQIKITHIYTTSLILFLIGSSYFFIILLVDWHLSKSLYGSFPEYIKHFSHYLVFAIVVIFQANLSIILKKFKNLKR